MTIVLGKMINGVDVDQLSEKLQMIRSDPELGRCEFRVQNRWLECGRNRSQVGQFYAAKSEQRQDQPPFVLECDEPHVLMGGDAAPNPVEYLLHALAGCVTSTLVYHAASRNIEIRSLETEVKGEIDLRGFLGLSSEVPKGYQKIEVKMRVDSDAPAEQLAELARFSPVYNTLINRVPVEIAVEKSS